MIIIDGHNLIGKYPGINFDGANAKQELLDILKKYKKAMDVKIIVVFDGADKAGFGRYIEEGIDIRFSDNKQADDLIVDLCKKFSHARDTIIVSSDNEIINAAKKFGLIPKKSEDFVNDINNAIERFNSIEQTNDYLSPVQIDDWMKYFKKK